MSGETSIEAQSGGDSIISNLELWRCADQNLH